MATTLQNILGYVTLTKAIQETVSGIPNPFPEKLFSVTEKTLKDKGRYISYTGERRTAQLNRYGGPSKVVDQREIKERDVKLLHSFHSQILDPLLFKYLREAEAYNHDVALNELKRQVKEFKKRFENLRIAAVAHALRYAKLYWDADGNLLPSSSGATETHTFGRSANNEGQLNGILSASWATAGTDIPLQLRTLKKRARKDHGQELKIAYYGENIPSYFADNTSVQVYMSRNDVKNDEFLSNGEIPQGLFGFNWIPVYEAFYEDSAGTNQDLWDADLVVFTPEINDSWWGMMEGSYEVPRTIDIQTADVAASSMETVYGQFGYSRLASDPITSIQYYGDTFVPLVKNPAVTYAGDTAF